MVCYIITHYYLLGTILLDNLPYPFFLLCSVFCPAIVNPSKHKQESFQHDIHSTDTNTNHWYKLCRYSNNP